MSQRVIIDHMLVGLLKVLSDSGHVRISVRSTQADKAFEAAFEELCRQAEGLGLDVSFRVTRRSHGDAPAFREALSRASQREEISFDNPEYDWVRLKSEELSWLDIENLPGPPGLYEQLARVFLESYALEGSVDTESEVDQQVVV